MSCKKKTCKYYKSCIVKRENDGTGCGDYERGEVKMATKFKKKSRYSDNELMKMMTFARTHLKYSEMTWAEIYCFRVPNKEVVEHLETLLNKKGVSLFG